MFIPSGAITLYMKIKGIVERRFSDRSKRPFVEIKKARSHGKTYLHATIRTQGSVTEKGVAMDDIDGLKRLAEEIAEL